MPGLKRKLGEELLTTHREYANTVLPLVSKKILNGIVHVTGGGFSGNIPRVMPKGLGAKIKLGTWNVLPIFKTIQNLGSVSEEEMHKAFNMGIGLVLIVSKENASQVKSLIKENVYEIGEVTETEGVTYERN